MVQLLSGALGASLTRLGLAVGCAAVTGSSARLHRYIGDHRLPSRLQFVPDPAWTEVPETLRGLRRQRSRWHRGLLDTLLRHRQMTGRRRYGNVGVLSLPAFALVELLGPVVDYVVVPIADLIGILNTPYMVAFLAGSFLLRTLLSIFAVLLDDIAFRRHARPRDLTLLVQASIVETLGYPQITEWWRVHAFWAYWRGDAGRGRMERRGLSSA